MTLMPERGVLGIRRMFTEAGTHPLFHEIKIGW